MNEVVNMVLSHIDELGYRFDWKELILGLGTPVFILALLIEMRVLKDRPEIFDFKIILTNFTLGFSYQTVEVVFHFIFLGAAMHYLSSFALFEIALNPLNLVLGFFAMEFLYYWYHRTNHRVRYFWCSHVVHHSSEGMNFSTATRQSMTYAFSGGVILFFSPLMIFGFPPEVVMSFYAIDLCYQYFVHTQAVGKLSKPVEFFFNTPSHHRVHHGRNPEYIDKNYGGVVIIFDRLFGTFKEEDMEENPVDYGIVKQIHTNNILKINFHEWLDMVNNIRQSGPISEKLKHIWAPPEWQRDLEDQQESSLSSKGALVDSDETSV